LDWLDWLDPEVPSKIFEKKFRAPAQNYSKSLENKPENETDKNSGREKLKNGQKWPKMSKKTQK
jgi:hypothetical protein